MTIAIITIIHKSLRICFINLVKNYETGLNINWIMNSYIYRIYIEYVENIRRINVVHDAWRT